ncbi:MAG: hypothetical protein K2K41_04025 [Ruminiclostridium sp.]|nr:hypothetical protein [Ruminiclostridium sp.]
MANISCELYGNFDEILNNLHNTVMEGSVSASFEDSSSFSTESMRCEVRTYERYSYFGKNRVSLSITLVESNGRIFISAITTGGSQAMFFKINTIGEESFLETIRWVIDRYSKDKN